MLGQIRARLLPRVAGQMTDHPAVPHRVAGRCDLRVHIAARDLRPAVVLDLKGVVADERCAEALRLVELIGVYLRLRMVVRDVARPAARRIHDLAVDHVGVRRILIVKDRAHRALRRTVPHAAAKDGRIDVGGTVEHGRKVTLVLRLLHKHRRALQRLQHDFFAARYVEAVGSLVEERRAVHNLLLAVPVYLDIARQDDERRLLQHILELHDLIFIHQLIADIHQHITLARRHSIVAML